MCCKHGGLPSQGTDSMNSRIRACHARVRARAEFSSAKVVGSHGAVVCGALAAVVFFSTGCGYHTAGHSVTIPEGVHTIAIPAFVNQTQTYKIEQRLTAAVVREMVTRTHYRVVNEAGDSADCALRGTVVSTSTSPLTYDSQSGRASSALVVVTARVTLTDRQG